MCSATKALRSRVKKCSVNLKIVPAGPMPRMWWRASPRAPVLRIHRPVVQREVVWNGRRAGDRLTLFSSITVTASEAFTKKNLNRDHAAQLVFQREHVAAHQAAGVPITRISVQAAFGCIQGEVTVADAMRAIADAARRSRGWSHG